MSWTKGIYLIVVLMVHGKHLIASYTTAFYPIYSMVKDEDTLIYSMQQLATGQTRFLVFSQRYNSYEQLLPLSQSPTNIAFFPNGTGFSFIDNGLIKVKQLIQRSAHSIEYDRPLYAPASVSWLDENWCILSACYGEDSRGIFMLNRNGRVVPILFALNVNYSFPSFINNSLFCIAQENNRYTFICIEKFIEQFYELSISTQETENLPMISMIPISYTAPIYNLKPLFLQMVLPYTGYFITHDITTEDMLYFSCYQWNKDNGWDLKKMFDFVIPRSFFSVSSYMYCTESIMPFLPRYQETVIYYTNYDSTIKLLRPYIYNIETGVSSLISGEIVNKHAQNHTFVTGINAKELVVFLGQMGDSEVDSRLFEINDFVVDLKMLT